MGQDEEVDSKAFAAQQKEVEAAWRDGREEDALELARLLIDDLWEDKDYSHIVEVYDIPGLQPRQSLYSFELAYALAEKRRPGDAEKIYEAILASEPGNSSVLNNLHIIKKNKDQFEEAWKLIQRANKLASKDEIIARNFDSMRKVFEERRGILAQFKVSSVQVKNEKEFVL
jgi:tetratricopeptide (TPR) repeat protein